MVDAARCGDRLRAGHAALRAPAPKAAWNLSLRILLSMETYASLKCKGITCVCVFFEFLNSPSHFEFWNLVVVSGRVLGFGTVHSAPFLCAMLLVLSAAVVVVLCLVLASVLGPCLHVLLLALLCVVLLDSGFGWRQDTSAPRGARR